MAGIDLARIRKSCIDSLFSCADNALQYLDEEQHAEISTLQSHLREYCSLEQAETWEDIENAIRIQRNIDGYSEDEIAAIVNRCCSSLDQRDHPDIKEFKKKINRSQSRQSTSRHNSQENLRTNEITTARDPFSKQPIKDGVRNPLCGHWYERSTISSFLQKHRDSQRVLICAYVGCDKPLPLNLKEMDANQDFSSKNSRALSPSFPDFIDLDH